MNKVSSIEELFIRACKTSTPMTRLLSIYRRYYIGGGRELNRQTTNNLTLILASIVDMYCPMKFVDVVSNLQKDIWFPQDERGLEEKALDMLISRIGNSKKDLFTGLRTPTWFKNKYGDNK